MKSVLCTSTKNEKAPEPENQEQEKTAK